MNFKLFALVFLIIVSPCLAINPRSMDTLEVKIIQSGTMKVSGNVQMLTLFLYIPQNYVESISITPDSWNYGTDKYGNKIVIINWKTPIGDVSYSVETIVRNKASHLLNEYEIDEGYLEETNQIVFTDEIRKAAYPHEKTMKRAAELAKWVHDYMTYDVSVTDQKTSAWVFENKRGVCTEYANLLSSMLKLNGIPTRHAVGYAYSTTEGKFQGHAWLEILTERGWVNLDPTWLQFGYVDATHIKTASIPDSNLSESIGYLGFGTVEWKRNAEQFEIIDYEEKPVNKIYLHSSGNLIQARIEGECSISILDIKSCVNRNMEPMLSIPDTKRTVWFCGATDVYWPYESSAGRYICPVTVFEQSGTVEIINISIDSYKMSSFYIEGPDIVKKGEEFTLKANGIIFSPNLTGYGDQSWNLKLNMPGSYKFYVNGTVTEKSVTVTEEKEFDIFVEMPNNATVGKPFSVGIVIKTDKPRFALVEAAIGNQTDKKSVFIEKEKSVFFNLTAQKAGTEKVVLSVYNNTVVSYTGTIEVKEINAGISVFSIIASIINGIGEFFSSIF